MPSVRTCLGLVDLAEVTQQEADELVARGLVVPNRIYEGVFHWDKKEGAPWYDLDKALREIRQPAEHTYTEDDMYEAWYAGKLSGLRNTTLGFYEWLGDYNGR